MKNQIVSIPIADISERKPAGPEQRELLEKESRFKWGREPAGTRAVVLQCDVSRTLDASYGESDDTVRLRLVIDSPGAAEVVSLYWSQPTLPAALDAVRTCDTVWVSFTQTALRITVFPQLWLELLGAVPVLGDWAVPARPQWPFPLKVELAEGSATGLERHELVNREFVLQELVCTASLREVLSALEAQHRTLSLELWSALCEEVLAACAVMTFTSFEELKAGVRWSATGTLRVTPQPRPTTPMALACEAVVTLAGSTMRLARTKRGPTPPAATPAQTEALLELLSRIAGVEFSSLDALRTAVRSVSAPASREQALGLVFSLAPTVHSWLAVLLKHPQLLPRRWEGVYEPPMEGRAALTVLADAWIERRVAPESLPVPVAAPHQPLAGLVKAPPPRVMNAARADAPPDEDEPEEAPPARRFKWPWQRD